MLLITIDEYNPIILPNWRHQQAKLTTDHFKCKNK